jgi:hypothetical protein
MLEISPTEQFPFTLGNGGTKMFEPIRELVVDARTGEKTVRELTDQEIAEQKALLDPSEEEWQLALRCERNKRLAETDWVTLKAIDDSNDGLGIQLPQVWMDYRQALRDLPANTVDPANPVWPTKPGGN